MRRLFRALFVRFFGETRLDLKRQVRQQSRVSFPRDSPLACRHRCGMLIYRGEHENGVK